MLAYKLRTAIWLKLEVKISRYCETGKTKAKCSIGIDPSPHWALRVEREKISETFRAGRE